MNSKYIIIIICLFALSCETLIEKKKDKEPAMEMPGMENNVLHLSNQQIQLGNITTDSLREHILGEELLLPGLVTVNENEVKAISARVMGRIERLYFKNAGEPILKGEPIYEIYSEDLNLAVKEFLLAKERSKEQNGTHIDPQKFLESSINKLKLYGLGDKEINALHEEDKDKMTIKIVSPYSGVIISVDRKEGDYVMDGGVIFHLADFSSVWVEAQIYPDLQELIREGSEAAITLNALPGKELKGKIIFINPELSQRGKINLARVEIMNEGSNFKPGMQAMVRIVSGTRKVLAIPSSALIMEKEGATVWVKTGEKSFKSKMVHTGVEAGGFTEILHGLEEGEEVVITGVYLLNSEYIFKRGANPMEGHDMSNM